MDELTAITSLAMLHTHSSAEWLTVDALITKASFEILALMIGIS
jgi:hypothetical protein